MVPDLYISELIALKYLSHLPILSSFRSINPFFLMAPHSLPSSNDSNDTSFPCNHHNEDNHNGDTRTLTMEDKDTTSRRKNNARGGWIVQKFGGTSIGKFPEQISKIAGCVFYLNCSFSLPLLAQLLVVNQLPK